MNIVIFLPFPISVNSYYLKGRILSKRGRIYKDLVESACLEQGVYGLGISERVRLQVIIYPPDRRVRDLDNCMKSLQDALTRSQVWLDDRQVDQLMIYRGEVVKSGCAVVRLSDGQPIIPDGADITLL